MDIKDKLKKANNYLTKGYRLINEAQEECLHEELEGKFESDTGNWCSSEDSYWVELNCKICEKRWVIYSDDPEYRKYSRENYGRGYGKMIYRC